MDFAWNLQIPQSGIPDRNIWENLESLRTGIPHMDFLKNFQSPHTVIPDMDLQKKSPYRGFRHGLHRDFWKIQTPPTRIPRRNLGEILQTIPTESPQEFRKISQPPHTETPHEEFLNIFETHHTGIQHTDFWNFSKFPQRSSTPGGI